ncbi:coiled coil-containing protein [Cryptosporidium canis]|uniref:Coiled coil-containing protein n=1 Tax=Cryptosporidium canis TaxID=195482 RepID=A0ABQ8P900_9CRYT|nr:coiled coil-containing protein [Cryptosporidium canis]
MSVNEEEAAIHAGEEVVQDESGEKARLLARIRELEGENKLLRERGGEGAMVEDLEKFVDDMDGTMNYSMQVVQIKDEELKRMGEKMLENNLKWKGYVKLLVDQIGKKNALIESMKEEMDKFFEKTKKQETANRENISKLTSYEELIQIDQQLLKQSKQIEAELNSRIRRLEDDNRKYSAAIKTISESTKKSMADYSSKMEKQRSMIRHLATIVDHFRGRFLYNNIGRQSGVLNQINKKSSLNDSSDKEVMNPLEYEFTVVWGSCQERLIRRRCDLLEITLNLEEGSGRSVPNSLSDLILNKNISVSGAFCAYSDYVGRVLGLYEVFCKSNILLQYLQFKALRYLQIGEISGLIKGGEVTGVIQWVCNLTIEVGLLTLDLGSLIMSIRSFSDSLPAPAESQEKGELSFSASLVSKLPSADEIKAITKWIDNISQDIINDNLSQNISYEQVTEFKNILHAKIVHVDDPHENIASKNTGIELLPVCCVDAIMNINISISILARINVKSIQEQNLEGIYNHSLQVSERFYSKCGSLTLNGIHYPIDDRLYSWNGLYWSRMLGQSGSGGFKASFEEMVRKQAEVYEAIHRPSENQQVNIADCLEKLLSSVQELDANLDDILNPIHMEYEKENCTSMSSLPEMVIAKRLQRLVGSLDDQIELELEARDGGSVSVFTSSKGGKDAGVEEGSAEAVEHEFGEDGASGSSGVAGSFDSPKKAKYESSIRQLNEKITSLKKELTEKEVLYSSFETMRGEYKKLQDHKQLLMRKIEEQELEMKISHDRARKYEDVLRQMKMDSDVMRRDLENLQNIPKIKAYSELDVLEPVYLRRLIRLMSNKLYELEMNRWNEIIIKEDPNRLLRSNYSRKVAMSRANSRNPLDSIAARLLERERRREERVQRSLVEEGETENTASHPNTAETHKDGPGGFLSGYLEEETEREVEYSDILTLIREFNDLQKQIMLHKCSIPIMNKRESGSSQSFEKEWEKYTRAESKLLYKLHIMKTALQGLLSGSGNSLEEGGPKPLGDSYITRKIGKLSLKIPAVEDESVLRMIKDQSNAMQVSIGEWNHIIQSLAKITT